MGPPSWWPSGRTRRWRRGCAGWAGGVRGGRARGWAPPPGRRPAALPPGRTVPDLPSIGVLPLDQRGPTAGSVPDLVDRLGLPRDPAEIAKAVLDGTTRRVDLLRT